MWRCVYLLFHPAFTEHQLCSKHCLKLRHKDESAIVPLVNEASAEKPVLIDQTAADFECMGYDL